MMRIRTTMFGMVGLLASVLSTAALASVKQADRGRACCLHGRCDDPLHYGDSEQGTHRFVPRAEDVPTQPRGAGRSSIRPLPAANDQDRAGNRAAPVALYRRSVSTTRVRTIPAPGACMFKTDETPLFLVPWTIPSPTSHLLDARGYDALVGILPTMEPTRSSFTRRPPAAASAIRLCQALSSLSISARRPQYAADPTFKYHGGGGRRLFAPGRTP